MRCDEKGIGLSKDPFFRASIVRLTYVEPILQPYYSHGGPNLIRSFPAATLPADAGSFHEPSLLNQAVFYAFRLHSRALSGLFFDAVSCI
jgi:hypothetical protein